MLREATKDEGAPAVAADEPTRERTPKGEGEKGRGTGEPAPASLAAMLLAVKLPAAAGEEKTGMEEAGAALVVSARRRLTRDKVRWMAAPTRLLLVAGWSRPSPSSSSSSLSVGWRDVSSRVSIKSE